MRKLLSVLYRPTVNDFRTTTSVVVPSFREDPDVLELALDTWLGQDPDQVIVVLDLADTEAQRRLLARNDPRLRVIMFKHAGKRSALGVGIRAARGEILVLTDSDTRWTDGLLASVQMPFADPEVGGVSTRQSVYQADTSVWRRVAEWIINNRYLDYVPATGRAGAVVCVSGRTAAYRREIVLQGASPPGGRVLPRQALHRGRRREVDLAGARQRLPDRLPVHGARPVDVPDDLPRLLQAAGALEPQLLPLLPDGAVEGLAVARAGHLPAHRLPDPAHAGDDGGDRLLPRDAAAAPDGTGALAFAAVWFLLGRALRNVAHLRTRPSDILLLPLVALVITFVALPIKLYAFLTMNKQGWLTRNAHQLGGDGQNAASLVRGARRVAG